MTNLNEYRDLWDRMEIVPSRVASFRAVARKLYKNIDVYRSVERATGVPAVVVAVIHERESAGDLSTYLGNGEPLSRVTKLVPKGRGPFSSFLEGAKDALQHEGWTNFQQWAINYTLYRLEDYNGAGYRNRGLRSPYIWGGTNQQQLGKYVEDGVFNPTVLDTQPGCAPLLKALLELDPSLGIPLALGLTGAPQTPAPVPTPTPRPEVEPATPVPAPASIWEWVLSIIRGLFGGTK